jgi:hypothetical protein
MSGYWANSHGHGMLHLQTSNQPPETIHFGILVVVVVVVVAASAAISSLVNDKGSI